MMTCSTVTTFALVSAILAVGIVIAVGSGAYALGGPGGSGGRGYPTILHCTVQAQATTQSSSARPFTAPARATTPSSNAPFMVSVQATTRLSSVVAAVIAPWKRQISRAGHRRPGAEDALP